MALNTRNRRSAAVLPAVPFRAVMAMPADGITTVGDLRHLAFLSRVGASDSDTLSTRTLIRGRAACGPAAIGESRVWLTVEGVAETLD